ncbi:AAA family ATPase [Caulobacter sp. BE254]|jgi:exopolysaccharide transport family protein|uniref:GumC family protein n=1 Tax=Caulobacter sp. BE254 TaxID=2817720 RepID=UPI00285E8676|nr:AAA family ATPase [Caulobacter sp. BE254]MDR7115018.1 exopolysaccharide transport family protein [Caulobacter sp. BE254]
MENSVDTQPLTNRARGSSGETIDVERLIAAFRRRLWLFVAVAGVIAAALMFVMLRQTPMYTATANVMINTRTEKVVDSQAVLSGLTADTGTVDTEVEVIKSPQLAETVVDTLKLDKDPEFNGALKSPGLIGSILGGKKAERAVPGAAEAERQAVIAAVGKQLTVRRVGLTYSITISFESTSAMKSATIANAFADAYLQSQLTEKFDATRQANSFLNTRLDTLRTQLQEADAAVSNYRVANNLLSSEGTTLTEQEISAYNQQLAQARAQQAEDEARLRTARAQLAAGSNGDDVGEALSSQVVQNLRAQRAVVSGRVAEMSGRYGERHPDMVRAQRELADIDQQIQAEIRRIVSNLEARVRVSQQRTASVEASLGGARGTLAANSAASVHLKELEGNAEAARNVYQSFLDRYKQTGAQQGVEQADARIASRAVPPSHQSSPNLMLAVALSIVVGAGAGLAAVIIAEIMDAGLATSDDVERKIGLASVASIPLMSSVAEANERGIQPIDYVLRKPLSGFAEAFRSLRTSILYAVPGQQGKIVVLTSALPGEGKTTTSICLARVAAQAGSKVLLLDCDLRRRAVTRTLGLTPENGLAEVLHGTATLESVVLLDQASGAYVLPLAHTASSTEDVFGLPAMDQLLAKARASFDLVILDTAPVLALADTRILAGKTDVVVLLARWRKTPARAIGASVRLLQQANAQIAGVALTQVDMNAQSKHGYGDAGYYYDEYKKYYAS